jgi:aryl-alcohol dehydrogenase-like predicted oxidoreductase
MLPIPGTSKVDHLEDNMQAAAVELSGVEVAALEEAGAQ